MSNNRSVRPDISRTLLGLATNAFGMNGRFKPRDGSIDSRGALAGMILCLCLSDALALTGTVVDAKGAALEGVTARLVLQKKSTSTDSKGAFTVLVIPSSVTRNPTSPIDQTLASPYDALGRQLRPDRKDMVTTLEFFGRSQAAPLDTLVLEKAEYVTRKLVVDDWNANLGTLVLDSLVAWPPVIGTYFPDASTTGPRPGIVLQRVDGDVRITKDRQVVENMDIYGRIIVTSTGTNAIVRNCIVRGPGGLDARTSVTAVITSTSNTSNSLLGLRVEDTRIDLTGRENPWVDGIREGDVHLLRVEIKRTVDGISLGSPRGNVVVEGSWIHDGYYTEWIEGTPGFPTIKDSRTHADAVQFHKGRNYVFRGNRFGGVRHPGTFNTHNADTIAYKDSGDDFENSCFMIKQEGDTSLASRLDTVLIEKNWIQGGASSINLSYDRLNTLKTFVIRDNVFPISTWGKQYYIMKDLAIEAVLQGNKHPDGSAVVISKGR